MKKDDKHKNYSIELPQDVAKLLESIAKFENTTPEEIIKYGGMSYVQDRVDLWQDSGEVAKAELNKIFSEWEGSESFSVTKNNTGEQDEQ